MVLIRRAVVAVFLSIFAIKVNASKSGKYLGTLDDPKKIGNTFNLIVDGLLKLYDEIPTLAPGLCLFTDDSAVISDKITILNREVITLLNSVSDEVNDFLPYTDNLRNASDILSDVRDELIRINIIHNESLRLRKNSNQNNGRSEMVTLDDFVISVFRGSLGGIPHILSFNRFIMTDNPSTMTNVHERFQTYIKNVAVENHMHRCHSYIANRSSTLEKYSPHPYWPFLVAEIKGFLTIAHGYLIRILVGNGKYGNDIKDMKNLSIKRIEDYIRAITDTTPPSSEKCNCTANPWKPKIVLFRNRRLYSIPSSNELIFFAKTPARTTLMVNLTFSDGPDSKSYEYIIKLGNDTIFIGAIDMSSKLVHVFSNANFPLSDNKFNKLWIRWNSTTISLGEEDNPFAIIDLKDDGISNIAQYFSINSEKKEPEFIIPGSPSDGKCWCSATNPKYANLPIIALEGGRHHNEVLYVCQASNRGSLIPGQLLPSRKICEIVHQGVVYPKHDYKILSGCQLQWKAANEGNTPSNAIVGGQTISRNEPLFICRFTVGKSIVIGNLLPDSTKDCRSVINGKVHSSPKYEVLVGGHTWWLATN